MNKSYLKKLSKSQLINLLLKQKPEKVQKKPKVAYNLENLFNDDVFPSDLYNTKMKKELDQQTVQIDDKYQKIKPLQYENVEVYPIIKTKLNDFRQDEIQISKDKNKAQKGFIELFKTRLNNVSDKKRIVSMTINVRINTGYGDIDNKEKTQYKNALNQNKDNDDEYDIPYKKVLEQKLFQKNNNIFKEKTYGPFTIEIPKHLSIPDTYKLAMYTLLNKHFHILSGEFISGIGYKLIKLNKNEFKYGKMGSLKLESYLLNKQRPITKHGVNTCVVDYVWDQVRGKHGFKTYTYEKLKKEIYNYVEEGEMINTQELINWLKNCHDNVSLHAFDSRYSRFITHNCKNTRSNVSLVYVVKDRHCYPITDEKLKLIASKVNNGCDNLLKYMSELKWTRRHENVTQLKSISEMYDMNKDNHIIVLPESAKINDAIEIYSTTNNFYIEYLHWNNNGILDGFIDHNKNMYLLSEEYDIRKAICDKLFETYKTFDFKWTNQSYTSIAMNLFKQLTGYIQPSSYNVKTRQMLDDFYPRALQWCTTDYIPEDIVSIDISKCYPSILLNNQDPIAVYSIHDVIEPFNGINDLQKCGEFYIDQTVLHNYSNPIKIEAGFYSSNLILYLVNELRMPLSQIKYQIISKRALKPNTFTEYMKYVFDNFTETEAKKLANSFIGELGRKYNKTNQGFCCTDWETACSCWTAGVSEGKNVTVDHYKDIYLIREQLVERIFSDHTSINRFVVSQSIMKCLQLIQTCHGKNSVLYGYNTDGIYLSNPIKSFKNKKDVKFSTKKIGRAYVTDNILEYFEKHYRENIDVKEYEIVNGKGIVFNGQAGSGKTTKLCEMVLKTENPLVLSFTNKAVENVKSRLQKMNYSGDANKICFTFDSYFCEWKDENINNLKNKTFFIEEFSMVPNKWITQVYKIFTMFKNNIFMFGDPNQCEPVENGSQVNYNYMESKTVNDMCPKIETLQYIEKSCRYDKPTHEMLKTFLKHGKISIYFNPVNNQLYKNICYLNKTRIKVNTECCNRFTQGKMYVTVDFKYDNKKETYNVCTDMPVLATTNIKDKNIFNTMEFKIEDIKENRFKINNEWFDKNAFAASFIPSFCVTVYKYQGADIDEHYNIYDVDEMDKKQLYTSLSRTTKLEYIHINYKELNNKYFNRKQPNIELINTKFNSLYKNGKIYKITFDNKKIYIGSTCEDLETRLRWHLTNNKSQVFKNKHKNPIIELLVVCPSYDKKSLEKVENSYIAEYAEKYGNSLLNIRANPLKVKKVEYTVQIENKQQLEERIAKLDKKLTIKDDPVNKTYYYDSIIDGKRYKTMARYGKKQKDKAFEQISTKKQKLINELTITFQ